MGTRSVIAVPTEDGWRGRYVHWDGYPTGVGEAVRRVVQRDGREAAVKTLTEENYGWSSVTGHDGGALGYGYDDGRFRVVSGYGIAYTTEQGQSRADEWITDTGNDGGTEWAYVIGDSGITVFERVWNDSGGHATGMLGLGASDTEIGGSWLMRGTVAFDDPHGMARIEEGR